MKRKHQKTLDAIFAHPPGANIQWHEVVSLMQALGSEVTERRGSRVAFILNERVNVQHRPHPAPSLDKGAVADLRDFLKSCGVRP
ncbi:type II toxin-antitoxin system HicA family toxin [Spiribacter vilamensis]|uniref:HicA-like toxin of HicAB toxin-antitoxin system n=1 Tax=Spiribacter vilamensis TaxID=531306 RepID=A0A4Q8D1I9_9GAMM|nr:type II toxin-antitoxin system HicA family toxin [Spiribacter vilamensis]RZU99120.1 HicA-like toxin of HicAB toxin-antitoxin system [Spiribacter vilamensis]TVO61884.1 type II toxin-antitoxin system HicA family toxin [Spiribacter vilamensis]